MGTLSSTNRKPDSPRARPGHRAVSICMDCVLVYMELFPKTRSGGLIQSCLALEGVTSFL